VTCRAIEIDACVRRPFAAVVANNKDLACNWQSSDRAAGTCLPV